MQNFRTYHLAVQLFRDCQRLKLRASLSMVLNLPRAPRNLRPRIARETQAILALIGHTTLQRSDAVAACPFRLIHSPGYSN